MERLWLLYAVLTVSNPVLGMDVKLGFMFPHDSAGRAFYTSKIGYSTSAGAVAIAVERIVKEQLLPNANLSVTWQFSQCDESEATGLGIEMLGRGAVDVIIGPPCGLPAILVGVLANYYNIPQISWAATSLDLADTERYPTLSRVIGSALRLGRAMKELLLYFDWTRVALFYTDDMATRKCLSVAQGAYKHFPAANIHIVYFMEVPREVPTDEELDIFFTHFPKLTRIAIVCIDMDADIRRFMLRAQERGCSGEEFVYLMPDYVRFENQSDVWTDRSVGTTASSRDAEARTSMQNGLFMEMLLSSNEELFAFKKRVAETIKGWPFYYDIAKLDEKYGSLYSPFLHDAVYLYAVALNKTLTQGGNKTDGRLIMENTKHVHFQGVSGHVVMDNIAGREPTFVVKGFTKDGRLTSVLKAEMYKEDGNSISLLVPEYAIWETRNGYAPKWHPRCGWTGDLCQEEMDSMVPFVVFGGVFALVVTVAAIVGGTLYYRNKILVDEMALMLWKIDPRSIQKLVDMHTDGSLDTINTDVSDDIADIMLRGNDRVAYYRAQLVWIKPHNVSVVLSSKTDHMQMKMLRDITHESLNPFVGLILEGTPLSVWRYCSKGSLQDVLAMPTLKLDWYFKYSLIRDLVSGMEYLHESGINSHGSLKSPNCLVSSRWVLTVTDFGLPSLKGEEPRIASRLWTAPEHLRSECPPPAGTQPGDVYSFSIVVGEIVTREEPFASYNKLPQEVVNLVRAGLDPPFRPDIQNQNDADMDPAMMTLMRDCWHEDPKARPDFKHIKSAVKQMNRGREGTLLDHAMKMMERYATSLETSIDDRSKQLRAETGKADDMLYKLLPPHIANKLKSGQSIDPESFDSLSIIISDIANFNKIAEQSNPLQIVSLLNDIYYQLDEILDEYDAFCVQTVNDSYVVACGLKAELANLRLARYYMAHLPKMKCSIRLGVHCGPVVAGIIGSATPRYVLFGETMSTARCMLDHAKAGTIHITETMNGYLTEIIGGFITKPRGEVQLHGAGSVFTFWLLGKKTKQIDDKTQSTSSGESGPKPGAMSS